MIFFTNSKKIEYKTGFFYWGSFINQHLLYFGENIYGINYKLKNKLLEYFLNRIKERLELFPHDKIMVVLEGEEEEYKQKGLPDRFIYRSVKKLAKEYHVECKWYKESMTQKDIYGRYWLDNGKYFVTSDLHGHFDEFLELLKNKKEEEILVIAGDFIDRGDQTGEIIEYLMKAEKRGVIVLKGNHESKLVNLWDKKKVQGVNQIATFRSLFNKYSYKQIEQMIEWMRGLRHIVFNDKVVITHAGLRRSFSLSSISIHECLNNAIMNEQEVDFEHRGDKIQIHGHVYNKNTAKMIYNIDSDQLTCLRAVSFQVDNKCSLEEIRDTFVRFEFPIKSQHVLEVDLTDLTLFNQMKQSKYIRVNEDETDPRYVVLKYNKKAFFNNYYKGFIKKARGLVFDRLRAEFINNPFEKFENDSEVIEEIKKRLEVEMDYKIYEKYNGFLAIMTKTSGKVIINCSGSIGNNAPFVKLTKGVMRKTGFNTNALQEGATYLFEVISLEDPHYVKYDKDKLVLLAVRYKNGVEVLNTKEMAEELNCEYAKEYSKKEFKQYLLKDLEGFDLDIEGFVVTFVDGFRVKVKLFESYLKKKHKNFKYKNETIKIREYWAKNS